MLSAVASAERPLMVDEIDMVLGIGTQLGVIAVVAGVS